MAFYGDRVPKFVRESTPERLESKLLALGAAMGQKLEVINIYESQNGGLVAWYFHDSKKLGLGNARGEAIPEQSGTEEKPKPKRRRKSKVTSG